MFLYRRMFIIKVMAQFFECFQLLQTVQLTVKKHLKFSHYKHLLLTSAGWFSSTPGKDKFSKLSPTKLPSSSTNIIRGAGVFKACLNAD